MTLLPTTCYTLAFSGSLAVPFRPSFSFHLT